MSGSVLPNQERVNETNPCYIPYANKNYFASTFTVNTGSNISFYNISTPTLIFNSNTSPTVIITPAQNGSLVQSCYVSSMGNNIKDGYLKLAPTNSSNFFSGQQYVYKYTILNQ
jgi:hypothetical protein